MKIALVGSAPSSVALAPYDDPSWLIWGCSPGAFGHLKRVDAFFELHRFVPEDPVWFPEYVAWMKGLTCPLYMIEPLDGFPTSVAYPKDAMIERFGELAPWTSSLAWMMAAAIVTIEAAKAHPTYVVTMNQPRRDTRGRFLRQSPPAPVEEQHEIAFYGVDMAATEEFFHQKPGCHYFIEKARELGIMVTAPAESDLLQPLPRYGIGEGHPMRIKLTARMTELAGKEAAAAAEAEQHKAAFEAKIRETIYFQGAKEDLQYVLNTWCE